MVVVVVVIGELGVVAGDETVLGSSGVSVVNCEVLTDDTEL